MVEADEGQKNPSCDRVCTYLLFVTLPQFHQDIKWFAMQTCIKYQSKNMYLHNLSSVRCRRYSYQTIDFNNVKKIQLVAQNKIQGAVSVIPR